MDINLNNNRISSDYGNNPMWPHQGGSTGVSGEYGNDPTWPVEKFSAGSASAQKADDEGFSLKDTLKHFKHHIEANLDCGGGKVAGILGLMGAGIGAGGAALLGGPALVAAGVGGAIGAAAGFGFTEWFMHAMTF